MGDEVLVEKLELSFYVELKIEDAALSGLEEFAGLGVPGWDLLFADSVAAFVVCFGWFHGF